MAYCVLTDLKKNISEDKIVDLAHDQDMAGNKDISNSLVIANIDQAIADADAEIDSYLLAIVDAVPISFVPSRIKKISCTLSIFFLHERRGSGRDNAYQIQRDDAVDWLYKLSTGKVNLDFGETTPDVRRVSRVRSNADVDDKEFTEEML